MTPEERARRKLLEEFQRGALDRIARINVLWIGLEKAPGDAATAEELLRELHTLKGECRMMGFGEVGQIVHRMEEVALWAGRQGGELPRELGDLVMDASDAAWQLLQQGERGRQAEVALASLHERFGQILGAAAEGREPVAAPLRPAAQEPPAAWHRLDEDFLRVDAAQVGAFSEATFDLRVRSRRVAQLARRISRILSAHGARLTERERDDLRAAGGLGDVAAARADGNRALAELLGELAPLCAGLGQEAEESELLLLKLDAEVRSLRLVPIASLLERYVRITRDLGREHGKEVTAKVSDAGVHLDKSILDRLAGPLAHLLRNAIDHGLEGAEERAAAGKPRAGTLSITAEPRQGKVALTFADDGRGIDPEAVRARAVELGLLGEDGALAPAEVLQLLFQPGVSTRRTVTETSGRGVGLDAVKREVEHLGGEIWIRSEAGRGTAIDSELPVSLALTRVLVICLGHRRFALPSVALSAVVSARAGDVEEVHHRPALRVRDERIPLVELGAILGSTPAATDQLHAIVLGQDGRRVALVVSGWEDDQDVVVKPLGELLEPARLFAGACLLESGELTLVLNPATLMAQALDGERDIAWRARPRSGAATDGRRQRILFAEDSPVTRSMIFGVLTELGYQVTSARDGREALDLLLERGADLVLTDFDMPAMNGLALVRQIRGHDAWKALPVIVLSTRDSEADCRRALEAGADEYLWKGGRWEAQLRKILRRKLEPPS